MKVKVKHVTFKKQTRKKSNHKMLASLQKYYDMSAGTFYTRLGKVLKFSYKGILRDSVLKEL